MASAAAARRSLSRARARAVSIAHRKRRDSHRGYPDLLQTHSVPVGGSLPAASFPNASLPVTLKFRVSRDAATADGKVVTLGGQGHVGFDVGRIEIDTGSRTFRSDFIGAPRSHAEVVAAIRPVDGQVRVWVDSECAIAGEVASFPYSWITSGSVAYSSVSGATVLSELEVYAEQLPRHFDECRDIADVVFCDLLYRAAHASQLATSEVPFLGAS